MSLSLVSLFFLCYAPTGGMESSLALQPTNRTLCLVITLRFVPSALTVCEYKLPTHTSDYI